MKNQFKFLAFILCALFAFSACSDDDDDNNNGGTPGAVKTVEFLNASAYDKWVYFSFDKGEIVTVTDFATDLSWDIAFHRGDIRLNGGKSGKGKGGVVKTESKKWDDVKDAPTSGYKTDEIGTITILSPQFAEKDQKTTEDAPFSLTLASWLTTDTSNPPPVYTIHGWIYILKTADGKYVKFLAYDNKSQKNAAGYFSFKYQYNADGSTKF